MARLFPEDFQVAEAERRFSGDDPALYQFKPWGYEFDRTKEQMTESEYNHYLYSQIKNITFSFLTN